MTILKSLKQGFTAHFTSLHSWDEESYYSVFSKETEPTGFIQIYIYREIHYDELAPTVMEAEESHESASWWPRKGGTIILVQT